MKVLFTTPVFGVPPIGGPELRIANTIRALSKVSELTVYIRRNHVSPLPVHDFESVPIFYEKNTNGIWSRKFVSLYRLHLSKVIMKFGLQEAKRIVELCNQENCQIVWFGYGNISLHVIRNLRKLSPSLMIVCDTDSVWSRFLLRAIPFVGLHHKIANLISGNLKIVQEKELLSLSNVLTAVSKVDAQYYEQLSPSGSCEVAIISNSVDISSRENWLDQDDELKHPALTIIGSFGRRTSAMDIGTRWFLEKVWERVRINNPGVTLYIVGGGSQRNWISNPNRGIEVLGRVESTGKILSFTDLNLVPLLFESGTRFKILESGMYRKPVVSTSLGAEGLDVEHGKEIIITDDPNVFAGAISEILQGKKFNHLGKNLHQKVLEKYTLKTLEEECSKVMTLLESKLPKH
jgi:glycosyltransferase involved in cell wall biosynthesis